MTFTALFDRAVTWAINWATPSVKFSGPLTSGPRETPGGLRQDPRVPVPQVAASPPATGAPEEPRIEIVPTWYEPTGLARIAAFDCLFLDVPGHVCLARDGQPSRGGGSCHASAQIMSRRGWERRYPKYYRYAVDARIVEAEKVS